MNKRCEHCNSTFTLKTSKQRFCSQQCVRDYANAKRKGKRHIHLEGPKHWNWKNGHYAKLSRWREIVLERGQYRCQECGSSDRIEAHHIKKRRTHPHLLYKVNNGIVLCKSCHSMADIASLTLKEKKNRSKRQSQLATKLLMNLSPKERTKRAKKAANIRWHSLM